MSNSHFSLKTTWATAALLTLMYSLSGCGSFHAKVKEVAVIEGIVGGIIKVDSEHGAANGVLSPEIIYDLYLHAPNAGSGELELWVTRDTAVYEQQQNNLEPTPFATLKDGEKVQAHVGAVDKSGSRPRAYVVTIIILK
jgi:hypothetical protein